MACEEGDSIIPVGLEAGGVKASFGRGRHNGTPVCNPAGISQYVVFGYGCFMSL